MKKYLIKSSAFTLALAMVLGLASCKDDVQVETTTDVASVETVSDIATPRAMLHKLLHKPKLQQKLLLMRRGTHKW